MAWIDHIAIVKSTGLFSGPMTIDGMIECGTDDRAEGFSEGSGELIRSQDLREDRKMVRFLWTSEKPKIPEKAN